MNNDFLDMITFDNLLFVYRVNLMFILVHLRLIFKTLSKVVRMKVAED